MNLEDSVGNEDTVFGAEEVDGRTMLLQLLAGQATLHADFERLASAVAPLLSKQYRETESRVRALEVRIRARQERPLVLRIAQILNDCRRLQSAEDVRLHVEESLLDALITFGYQEFGTAGDQYDPVWHEPLEGGAGSSSVVTNVFSRGLACYGDVLIKAKVAVAPLSSTADEQT